MKIETSEQLRTLYSTPSERAQRKQLGTLDDHCRRFVALSPFVVLASSGPDGADATPRGGPKGFVHVADARTLLLPDWPGNNRLDSLTNILTNPDVGLLFLIPGVDETLRVNGSAEVRTDATLRERFCMDGRLPTTVLVISVHEAFLHCAKAFMWSRLWDENAKLERTALPTLGEMLKAQLSLPEEAEAQETMARRYRDSLYQTGLFDVWQVLCIRQTTYLFLQPAYPRPT